MTPSEEKENIRILILKILGNVFGQLGAESLRLAGQTTSDSPAPGKEVEEKPAADIDEFLHSLEEDLGD